MLRTPEKIINYITFKNNEEFVKWQNEEYRQIIQIAPLMMEVNLGIDEFDDGKDKGMVGKGENTFGIFVTYSEEV